MAGARRAKVRMASIACWSARWRRRARRATSSAGEAKVAGRAVEVPTEDGAHRFRIELTEVVHTRVEGDGLLTTAWHEGRGVQEHRRA